MAKSQCGSARARKAGLKVGPSIAGKRLRQYSKRVSGGAEVYLAAVGEYLALELMDVAKSAKAPKTKTLNQQSLFQGVSKDDELAAFFGGTIGALAVPAIHYKLLPKKSKKAEKAAAVVACDA